MDLSWNQFIPDVTAAGSMIRNNQPQSAAVTVPIPGTGIPMTIDGVTGIAGPQLFMGTVDLPRWNVAGTIQASININLAMFENMNRLRLDYEAGLLSYETARAQLERDVRIAYHNMLLLQENILLLRGSFENAERQAQMAQDNFNAGLAPELTLLQAQVARENLRPIIDQAENGFRVSMAQFAMFLDLPFDTYFELLPVDEIDFYIPLDLSSLISRAAVSRPEIMELRQGILLLNSARTMARNSLFPTLSLSWNSTSAFTQDPFRDSWFDGDAWMRTGALTLSLALRLHSLLPFSLDTQAIRNLDDQIVTAGIGLAQLVRGTEVEIYNTVLSLERARVGAEVQQQTVALAELSFQLTEQAYQAGLLDLFQVQSAEQALHQARVQMLEQQFSFLNDLIVLEYVIGVPFGTLSATGVN